MYFLISLSGAFCRSVLWAVLLCKCICSFTVENICVHLALRSCTLLCGIFVCNVWSGSKGFVNFPWQSLQRSRENYFRNFGILLRETNHQKKKKKSCENHCVLDLECRILSQEPSDSCILCFNAIFYEKQAEEDIYRQLMTCECYDK